MLQAQIFLDDGERGPQGPLHEYIMGFLLKTGVRGATLYCADQGFGLRRHLHMPGRIGVLDERPIVITFIDEDEKVREALKHIKPFLHDGIAVTHRVEPA